MIERYILLCIGLTISFIGLLIDNFIIWGFGTGMMIALFFGALIDIKMLCYDIARTKFKIKEIDEIRKSIKEIKQKKSQERKSNTMTKRA